MVFLKGSPFIISAWDWISKTYYSKDWGPGLLILPGIFFIVKYKIAKKRVKIPVIPHVRGVLKRVDNMLYYFKT